MTRVLLLTILALALPTAAHAAAFGPARLVSVANGAQAAGSTNYVDVSADGRYVLWASDAPNLPRLDEPPDPEGGVPGGGIFRRDLVTGETEIVAPAYRRYVDQFYTVSWGASGGSISADGRYVAFNANGLSLAAGPQPAQVYVRDMTVPFGAPGSITAVGPGAIGSTGAISDDGRKVAFGNGGDVYVRELDADRTVLVSARRDPERGVMLDTPAGDGAGEPRISGDGTTVIWVGNGQNSVPVFANENAGVSILWRRYVDGPRSATRRVNGAGDPEDPGCVFGADIEIIGDPLAPAGPCEGYFANSTLDLVGFGNRADISRDGRRVAFRSMERPRGVEEREPSSDIFVATMFPGDTRKTSTRDITRASITGEPAAAAHISDVAISPDGTTIAFSTTRVRFTLANFAFTGVSLPAPGVSAVYVADLSAGSISLASASVTGGPLDDSERTEQYFRYATPSVADRGARVAFLSSAQNLVIGDANRHIDAFVVSRQVSDDDDRAGPDVEVVTPPGPELRAAPDWRLRVTSRPAPGGVALDLSVPGAGTVRATVRDGGASLATAQATINGAGELTLNLRPDAATALKLPDGGTLDATADVRFTAGDRTLERSVPVTLLLRELEETLRVRATSQSNGRVKLTVDAPVAGLLQVDAKRGRRPLAATRTLVKRPGRVAVTLRRGGARVKGEARVRFRPAEPRAVTRTVKVPVTFTKGRR